MTRGPERLPLGELVDDETTLDRWQAWARRYLEAALSDAERRAPTEKAAYQRAWQARRVAGLRRIVEVGESDF